MQGEFVRVTIFKVWEKSTGNFNFSQGKVAIHREVRENWNYNTADIIPLTLKETFQAILVLKVFPLNEVGGFLYKEISVFNELVEKTGTRKG